MLKSVFVEVVCVVVAGTLFAALANAVSPRGLNLGRDYFHLAAAGSTNTNQPAPSPSPASTNADAAFTALAETLRTSGLRLVDRAETRRLFLDPRKAQDLVVFIDARPEDQYVEGHIPGAFGFDNYHPEKALGTVVPACQAAWEIVVYCHGGDCEESKFAALTLRDYLTGPSRTNLMIYAGGITEWVAAGDPVETGARNSGQMATPPPPAKSGP